MPHISIKAETLFTLSSIPFTNSLITSIIVLILMFVLGLYFKSQIASENRGNFFYLLKYIVQATYSFFQSILGDRVNIFFPLVATFFFFVLFQNWFGLLPGVGSVLIRVKENHESVLVPILRGSDADLNTTLALAMISFAVTQFYGVKYLGLKNYLKKFIILKDPILFVSGILEIISELSHIISFAFRLFGNIFAGEVLLSIMAFLIPVLASFPFLVMEFFFGFIQAMIFSVLTAVFINMAMTKAAH